MSMQPAALELSVIMPCLDEAETLGRCIDKARQFFEKNGVSGEVIVADNGSRDGSREIAARHGARVVPVQERGYGAALLGGIAAANSRFAVMGDADDSYDFTELLPFLARLRAGDELVVGNRFTGGISVGAMPWLHRYLGNPVLSWLGRLFFRVPIGDFHCGLRAFDVAAIRRLGLQASGMEFASEMIVRAALEGLRISEVPTTLAKDGRSRRPHLRTWRDGWRHLKFLLMYSPKWLFLAPGLFLVFSGLLLAAVLFVAPRRVFAGIGLDLNAYIGAVFAVIFGLQLLWQWVLARMYAASTGLLPQTPLLHRLRQVLGVDRLSMAALLLVLLGAGLFGWAVASWAETGFGALQDGRIPKVVVAGLALVVIGAQTFFSALMLGFFSIPVLERRSIPRGHSETPGV
jgi:glycosyltransferase involved in cell wall biosynthesis